MTMPQACNEPKLSLDQNHQHTSMDLHSPNPFTVERASHYQSNLLEPLLSATIDDLHGSRWLGPFDLPAPLRPSSPIFATSVPTGDDGGFIGFEDAPRFVDFQALTSNGLDEQYGYSSRFADRGPEETINPTLICQNFLLDPIQDSHGMPSDDEDSNEDADLDTNGLTSPAETVDNISDGLNNGHCMVIDDLSPPAAIMATVSSRFAGAEPPLQLTADGPILAANNKAAVVPFTKISSWTLQQQDLLHKNMLHHPTPSSPTSDSSVSASWLSPNTTTSSALSTPGSSPRNSITSNSGDMYLVTPAGPSCQSLNSSSVASNLSFPIACGSASSTSNMRAHSRRRRSVSGSRGSPYGAVRIQGSKRRRESDESDTETYSNRSVTDNHYTALELVKPRARTTIKREDSAAHHSRLRSSSSGSPQRSLDGLDEDEELTESDGDDYQRHHRYSSHFRPVKKRKVRANGRFYDVSSNDGNNYIPTPDTASSFPWICREQIWELVSETQLKSMKAEEKNRVRSARSIQNAKTVERRVIQVGICMASPFKRHTELERHRRDHIQQLADGAFYFPGHTCGICGHRQTSFRMDNFGRHQEKPSCKSLWETLPRDSFTRRKFVVKNMSVRRRRELNMGNISMVEDDFVMDV